VNLHQFHHGIRSARTVLQHEGGTGSIVIMGSQSILASYPAVTLSPDLLMSAEVDIMPVDADAAEIERLSDHLHGSLGQDSLFQETHGFHVDGITIDTAVLAAGWVDRLIPAVDPASGATAWCLDPHDLAIAKLIAGRPKDIDFVRLLVTDRLVDTEQVRDGLVSLDDPRAVVAIARLDAMAPLGLEDTDRRKWKAQRRRAVADRMARTTETSPAEILNQI
jgi:hypothetical protein